MAMGTQVTGNNRRPLKFCNVVAPNILVEPKKRKRKKTGPIRQWHRNREKERSLIHVRRVEGKDPTNTLDVGRPTPLVDNYRIDIPTRKKV